MERGTSVGQRMRIEDKAVWKADNGGKRSKEEISPSKRVTGISPKEITTAYKYIRKGLQIL
jgi:hypothetical protein